MHKRLYSLNEMKYNLNENNVMKDSVKETLKRLGISLTKETDKDGKKVRISSKSKSKLD